MAALHPTASRAALAAISGPAVAAVLQERVRQIDAEGFTLALDLAQHPGNLPLAALSLVATAVDQLFGRYHPPTEHPDTWPWSREAWRPGDARENLVQATSILLAAIDRLDHAPADDRIAA